ncbi:MAG: hypothetical protein H7144_10410 [Burkholderiales bacterium]|nr:hypothetical protein [Phycisphaerae bacterium]
MEWLFIGFAGLAGLAMLSVISHERQRQSDAKSIARRQAQAAENRAIPEAPNHP